VFLVVREDFVSFLLGIKFDRWASGIVLLDLFDSVLRFRNPVKPFVISTMDQWEALPLEPE
jgi:hypothetical protein